MEDLRRRRDRARTENDTWDSVNKDAYAYTCPYRRSTKDGRGDRRVDHLFDNTGVVSTFRGAGQLQQDLFPPGQVFFNLKPGPISVMLAKSMVTGNAPAEGHDLGWFERQLDAMSNQLAPFFLTGEWDNAVSELCIDLYIGTGVMLILEGDDDNPIRFVTLPREEVTLEPGPYGDVSALFWATRMSRRAIKTAFPNGTFDHDFEQALKDDANGETTLYQDFLRDGAGWQFIASVDGCNAPISKQVYKTQPFIASRFYRVPGEVYGRGPALLALPTVKTLNKAMELLLKNFAIQMLGMWGYRPGGTFVPENAPIRPGGFWPMQSTGGVMGPDVMRLDAGGNAAAMSQIVLGDLRTQVQTSLHDEQLPDGGATPKSAAEIVARVARMKQNYVGAYGRMIHEIIPVAIRRVMEIAYKRGLVTSQIALDKMLVTVDVISPLAQALKADHYKAVVESMQLVAQLEGPQAVARRFDLDTLMPQMIRDLGVDSNLVRTAKELAAYDQAMNTKQQASEVTSAMLQAPDKFASALNPVPDNQNQPAAAA